MFLHLRQIIGGTCILSLIKTLNLWVLIPQKRQKPCWLFHAGSNFSVLRTFQIALSFRHGTRWIIRVFLARQFIERLLVIRRVESVGYNRAGLVFVHCYEAESSRRDKVLLRAEKGLQQILIRIKIESEKYLKTYGDL